MSVFGTLYLRWMRDRTVSLVAWTVGILLIVVLTAAFYPSVGDTVEQATSGGGDGGSSDVMSTFLGLSAGIDPGSPLGFLRIGLYANICPLMLMALGVSLGIAAIAGDEETRNLEYLLSGPVHRMVVVFARFAGFVSTIVTTIGVGGYVLSTLSEMTGDLEALTWLSPWRWYVDDAMLVNGLDWPVLFPFGTAIISLAIGWQVFVRRDLKGG